MYQSTTQSTILPLSISIIQCHYSHQEANVVFLSRPLLQITWSLREWNGFHLWISSTLPPAKSFNRSHRWKEWSRTPTHSIPKPSTKALTFADDLSDNGKIPLRRTDCDAALSLKMFTGTLGPVIKKGEYTWRSGFTGACCKGTCYCRDCGSVFNKLTTFRILFFFSMAKAHAFLQYTQRGLLRSFTLDFTSSKFAVARFKQRVWRKQACVLKTSKIFQISMC